MINAFRAGIPEFQLSCGATLACPLTSSQLHWTHFYEILMMFHWDSSSLFIHELWAIKKLLPNSATCVWHYFNCRSCCRVIAVTFRTWLSDFMAFNFTYLVTDNVNCIRQDALCPMPYALRPPPQQLWGPNWQDSGSFVTDDTLCARPVENNWQAGSQDGRQAGSQLYTLISGRWWGDMIW